MKFNQVILQDGSSFKVHSALASVFPSRFRATTTAVVECHMTLSLFTQSPVKMSVSADTASERAYLPEPEMLRDQLLLADAGYPDFDQIALSADPSIHGGDKRLSERETSRVRTPNVLTFSGCPAVTA
ncbi:hypothetical protein ABLB69_05000 [Xenorhabdus khoisanae]|uniref:hypothetical protein n=1 Tax=Xenorhabdus khoisanae TaxID=880157 RepID=UPI0032B70A11